MSKLKHDEWLPQAQRKLIGGRKSARGDHTCGDPGSLMMTREGARLSAYCFRCGATGQYMEQETPKEKLARLQEQAKADEFVRRGIDPPDPTAHDPAKWPERDKLWFYSMGLSPRRIKELGLYYNADTGRVVLPIREADQVVFWMARSQTASPKWIGPRVKKRGLFAKYGQGRGSHVVLTEDPLSAYKIGLVCEAWSLLGTKVHPRHVLELNALGKPIITWLDDDLGRKNGSNPGQEAAAQIAAELRAAGLHVENMKSPRDPKYYSQYQLKEMLECNTTARVASSSEDLPAA